ncbi:MAG: hypothetical protein J6W96_00210 [Alphaproteobacteria bacterium]|nr:hypothetical protein [Alphaproteobacteria bacterium]
MEKKVRRGILKTFGCLMGALGCIACAYWAIFEWHPEEVDVAARTFRLMTIFIAVILGFSCIFGAVLWSGYARESKNEKKRTSLFED